MVNCMNVGCVAVVARRKKINGVLVCPTCYESIKADKAGLLKEASMNSLESFFESALKAEFANISVCTSEPTDNKLFLKLSYKDGKRKLVVVKNPDQSEPVFLVNKVGGSDMLNKSYGSLPYFLLEAMNNRPFDVYTIDTERPWVQDRPQQVWLNTDPQERQFLMEALKDRLIGMFESKGTLKFALVKEGKVDFCQPFKDLGFDFLTGEKSNKRFIKLLNSFTLFSKLPTTLKVKLLPDRKELDGMIGIHPRLVATAITNSYLKVDGAGDEASANSIARRSLGCRVFNGVAALPGYGLLKGQFVLLPRDSEWDVVTSTANIKSELTLASDAPCGYLALDTSPGKDKAYLNQQATQFMPSLFGIDLNRIDDTCPVYAWLDDLVKETVDSLRNGELLFTLDEILEDADRVDLNSVKRVDQINLAMWYDAHGGVKTIPQLVKRVTESTYKGVVDLYERSIRIRIPDAKYIQVISESAVRLILGIDLPKLEKDSSVYLKEFKFLVVSDEDFIRNYVNHGGNDLDDKFCVMWRIKDGRMIVIVHRNPCDIGEYAVYNFEGNLPPHIEGNVPLTTKLPQQLTEMPKPMELSKVKAAPKMPYTWDHAIAKVIARSVNPGTVVNCITLWNTTYGTRNTKLPYMETCIDALTSCKSKAHTDEILALARELVTTIVDDKSAKVDKDVWGGVRGLFSRKQFEAMTFELEETERFSKSWYTHLLQTCNKRVQKAMSEVEGVLEEDRQYLDWNPLLEGINKDLATKAKKMVEDRYRKMRSLHNFDDADRHNGKILPHVWVRVNEGIELHIKELTKQFELWGLDPKLVMFALLGKHVNSLPVADGYMVLKKAIFNGFFEASLEASNLV